MGFFQSIKNAFSKNKDADQYLSGLKRSRGSFVDKIKALAFGFKKVDEDFLEELMIILLEADVGIHSASKIIEQLEEQAKKQNIHSFNECVELLIEIMKQMYGNTSPMQIKDEQFNIILMVGVNGSGKTTTTAKLVKFYKDQGKKVCVCAADTFRAGAVKQLQLWADKLNVDCISGAENADPSSVIVDAIRQVKNTHDILIIDSAGRLQNKVNLMNELAKMNRVIEKEYQKEADEILLVIDATTGQNGIAQAQQFVQATKVSGIVLSKLDGSAKGGIVIAIRDLLSIPVKFVGLGEKEDDLKLFDVDAYLYSLCEGLLDE